MKKRIKYTAQQIGFLRTGYMSMNVRNLTKAFNDQFGTAKTEGKIKSALANHRIKCGRKGKDRLITPYRIYTEEQELFIREHYTALSLRKLVVEFNRRFDAHTTPDQMKTFVNNHGIKSGRTGCFPKGHAPWNAGTKGQGLTDANVRSFKKGNVPANRKPLGSERICPKDGFILIKVAERNPYTGFLTRYKHKHVHVWEQVHGPVPKGMVVAFRDSNKLNTGIENLMLLSRAELLRLNQHGYKDTPDQLKPSVLALARLEVKTFSINNDQP